MQVYHLLSNKRFICRNVNMKNELKGDNTSLMCGV